MSVVARDRLREPLASDPLERGATLRLFANGATSTSQTFAIPPGAFQEPNGPGWTRSVRRRRAIFRYVDERGENGPVTGIFIRQNGPLLLIRVTLDGRGNNEDILVLPPDPGTDGGMTVAVEDGDTLCATFGGAVRGRITDNDARLFRIAKPRGRACPVVSSVSGAFFDE